MLSMEMTRLIERCRQGDAEALGELYKAYAQKMRGVCRRYVDEQVVDDVLHDAFVIIFTSFDRLRDVRKAESWILAITRNVASKYKDHQNAIPTVPLESAATMPASEEEPTARGIPLDEVMQALNRLPEGYANVFRLSVFEGLSHKEIAALLDIEPHSSSSQLTRAKKMLRKSLARYWMLWLLPLLLPLSLYLFKRNDASERQKAVATGQDRQPSVPKPVTPNPITADEHDGNVRVLASHEDMSPVHRPAVDTTKQDICLDTILVLACLPLPDLCLDTAIQMAEWPDTYSSPELDSAATPKKKQAWSTMLAYAGLPSMGTDVVDNFLTVVDYASDGHTRSIRIYNWGEYIDYVNNYASEMDSVDAMHMTQMAIFNADRPDESVSERKHHERPQTFELSLNYSLNERWYLSTGLNYTRMRSVFESDGHQMLTRRTQKIGYVGLPLKLTYTLVAKDRWQLYASGGLQVEAPVSGKETTHYLYAGPPEYVQGTDSLVMPTSHRTIQVPWQWSVNVGAGVQYRLLPHVNAYFEPRLQYYIPTGSPVETYRTEHPFDLSLPFGIRFSW